jgi:hypothetical protein
MIAVHLVGDAHEYIPAWYHVLVRSFGAGFRLRVFSAVPPVHRYPGVEYTVSHNILWVDAMREGYIGNAPIFCTRPLCLPTPADMDLVERFVNTPRQELEAVICILDNTVFVLGRPIFSLPPTALDVLHEAGCVYQKLQMSVWFMTLLSEPAYAVYQHQTRGHPQVDPRDPVIRRDCLGALWRGFRILRRILAHDPSKMVALAASPIFWQDMAGIELASEVTCHVLLRNRHFIVIP